MAVFAVAALAFALTGGLPGIGGTSRALGNSAGGEPVPQTDDSIPASDVTMIGATPIEAGAGSDETWGVGQGPAGAVVVRYAAQNQNLSETGWSLGPGLENEAGQPLAAFEPDTLETSPAPSPLAGQMTADGAGVLAGTVEGTHEVLLVRNPNNPSNAFRETKPRAEAELEHGQRLFSFTRAPLIAALDESEARAGALVVPVAQASSVGEASVLYWDGTTEEWSKEKIEMPSGVTGSEFHVLGIAASSPSNAWLLGEVAQDEDALFRRQLGGSEGPVWQPVALESGGKPGEAITVEGEAFTIPGAKKKRVQIQVLTVTSEGVWIDGERPNLKASTTLYFDPDEKGHPSMHSWCTLEAPGGKECDYELPEPLPKGSSRSFAWANPATEFGERVITGFSEGVSLRLEGNRFKRVLALGGSPGSQFGAAFSSPSEGWLGNFQLPVHLTVDPQPTRLTPWSVPFRHALVAIAPEPQAGAEAGGCEHPAGSRECEALAVGDDGEVARYDPGEGWLPESLFGPGERRETPRLRAVAWPVPNRAYAVGDRNPQSGLGQMWLWRGETGLWEPDPATPYNFTGNLLGIAFDPSEPARGYAVGESGVLLSYGKTWTQEPTCGPGVTEPCLPAEVADASFTSVAFAGSEAIVAYRILPNRAEKQYVGGLLVNDGSGWQIEKAANEAMASGVPWAVAGLPDGGAAFGASGIVYEREGPTAPWVATPTPFPGGGEPGSLALFRENNALRVLATGQEPETYGVESKPEAPPGFPPVLIEPYPLSTDVLSGVLRQTSTGWSDEEHELNNATAPPGDYKQYDMVFQPDPVFAALVSPTGSEGWAVGGFVEPPPTHEGALETADVDRYRGESTPPPGHEPAPVPVKPEHETGREWASFAVAGGAQCAAPCSDRAEARIGADVWLERALATASNTSLVPGLRAFLYTGPRVVSPNALSGPKEEADKISYERELGRYTEILHGGTLPAYAVATETDLDEGSETPFVKAFSSFPFEEAGCGKPGCYVLPPSVSGGVTVIVLDDSTEVQPAQAEWLKRQLEAAKQARRPAIVVSNEALNPRLAEGNEGARRVAQALVTPGACASAFFYDAPEENIQGPLQNIHFSQQYRCGSEAIPTFGSGTLGYVNFENEVSGAFLGDSGFLVAQVDLAAADRKPGNNNVAPVSVELVPNVGELAIEAVSGTLLRRSEVAQFAALARRWRAGNRTEAAAPKPDTNLYVTLPNYCVGVACESEIKPEYEFSSSNKKVGSFVEPNFAASLKGTVPLLGANEKPIEDPKSGLFCAYNKGTTTVRISTGGLQASLLVTVQAGSVRKPCETVPLENPPVPQPSAPAPPPAPAPAPTAASAAPTAAPLPVPPPPPVIPPTVRATPVPAATPFFAVQPLPAFVPPFVPPPVPTPARPTPPSGTSAVEAVEREEEEESAPESVSNKAVAYQAPEHEPSPLYLVGILVLAAFAGASVRRRPRRGRRELRVAPATTSTMRSQRRMSERREPPDGR